jgi:ribosomal protein S18 acetylase RimI-like enzyme
LPGGALHTERIDARPGLTAIERRDLTSLFAGCFADCGQEEEPADADWRWVVRSRDRIVCHACVRRQSRTGRLARFGHLAYFATLSEWRGHGLGAQVLRQVQTEAPLLGLDVVVLHAARDAVRLYQRLGWIEIAPSAYYRADKRHDKDPVLAWSLMLAKLQGLHRVCYQFQRDW